MKSALRKIYLPSGQAMWRLKRDQQNFFGDYYWPRKGHGPSSEEFQCVRFLYGNRGRESSGGGWQERALFPVVYQVRDILGGQ